MYGKKCKTTGKQLRTEDDISHLWVPMMSSPHLLALVFWMTLLLFFLNFLPVRWSTTGNLSTGQPVYLAPGIRYRVPPVHGLPLRARKYLVPVAEYIDLPAYFMYVNKLKWRTGMNGSTGIHK